MSPETARHRAALRLALAATLALVWGTMAGAHLPGLTAVLAAQILVGMPRPPRPGQAAALIVVIAITGGAAFAITSVFSDRLLMLTAALGLLFFLGFAMRERAAGRSSLPATMLLNATAVVPVLTFQAEILGAGVISSPRRYGQRSSSGSCTRYSQRHRKRSPPARLDGRNDHAASAADTSTMVDRRVGWLGAFFVISACGVNLVSFADASGR